MFSIGLSIPRLTGAPGTALSACLGLIVLLVLGGCGEDSPPTEPEPEPEPRVAPTLEHLDLSPLVVPREGAFHVSASVAGPDVEELVSLRVDLRSVYSLAPPGPGRPVQRLLMGGQAVDWIALRDDGTGGDAEAGDGTFTSPAVVPEMEEPPALAALFPLVVQTLEWRFPDTTVVAPLEGDRRMRLEVVDADLGAIPRPPVTELGEDARRTAHVVSLRMPLADQVFPAAELRTPEEMAAAYYERVDHDPDFIITYQPGARSVALPAAYYIRARGQVEGIGSILFDNTDRMGSGGALQGVANVLGMGNPEAQVLVHELGHQWFAYLDPDLGLGAVHWSGELDRETSGFRGEPYNDLELYLMGLIPADSVIPPQVGTTGVTIQDIIDVHGPRMPAWPDAQREFTAVTLVVAERLLTDDELALFDFVAASFAEQAPLPGLGADAITFFHATGGRARLSTLIPDA